MKRLLCVIFGHKESEPVVRGTWNGVYCERCHEWLRIRSKYYGRTE